MDSDATLQSTLEDYQEKFCNKKCLLELNYKKMNDDKKQRIINF